MSVIVEVHLVHEAVDLGSHVRSAWFTKEAAQREADRLEAEYIALYGKLRMTPNYWVETMEVRS